MGLSQAEGPGWALQSCWSCLFMFPFLFYPLEVLFNRFWLSAGMFGPVFYLLTHHWRNHKSFQTGESDSSDSGFCCKAQCKGILFCLVSLALGGNEQTKVAREDVSSILCAAFWSQASKHTAGNALIFHSFFTMLYLDWALSLQKGSPMQTSLISFWLDLSPGLCLLPLSL